MPATEIQKPLTLLTPSVMIISSFANHLHLHTLLTISPQYSCILAYFCSYLQVFSNTVCVFIFQAQSLVFDYVFTFLQLWPGNLAIVLERRTHWWALLYTTLQMLLLSLLSL